ncbi:MAG: hypothetical protein V5A13_10280, partial [Haloarculaceae archaeon]
MTNPHRETAVSALVDRDWRAAGDAYTRAAHRDLGDGERGDGTGGDVLDPGARDRPAAGLSFLLTAGLCYRLAGTEDRARYRALTAAPLALDARDHVREGVERAVCQEFVADAAVVRGAEDAAAEAYDRAERLYRTYHPEDPLDAATGPLFDAANRLLLHASRNYRGVEWDDLHGSDPDGEDYLAHRARYKARTLPEAVARVLEAGQLHVPRGSTEYNN